MLDENKTGATDTSATDTVDTNTEGAQGADKKGRPEFTPEQEAYFKKTIDAEFARINKRADKKLEEIKEAEKLKNMSAEERVNAELQKAQAKIAEYEKQQLISQFKVELTEKGLPSGFAEHIAVTDAEQAKTAVDFLSKYKSDILKEKDDKIKQLEEDLRNASLRGTPPKQVFNAPKSNGLTGMGQFINKLSEGENKL